MDEPRYARKGGLPRGRRVSRAGNIDTVVPAISSDRGILYFAEVSGLEIGGCPCLVDTQFNSQTLIVLAPYGLDPIVCRAAVKILCIKFVFSDFFKNTQ